MAAPEQLAPVCLDKQPVYFNDPALSWEQRLAFAYDEASRLLKAATPPGTVIDAAQYELAADVTGGQLDINGSAWLDRFQSSQDALPENALTLPAAQMRQYYLGKYAQASANLGGYLTGYAREQIPLGSISQADFDKGAEIRLRAFSEIIHAGRTGMLPAIISGEDYAKNAVGQKPANIVIATPGVTVVPGAATAGFGEIALATIVVIGVVSWLVVAGTVVALYWSYTSKQNRAAMLEICQDAVRRNDPRAPEICKNMATVVADMADPGKMPSTIGALIPPEMQKEIATYAAMGVGAYLLISFAPEIIRSLGRAKDEMTAQRQLANLSRFAKRHGRSW